MDNLGNIITLLTLMLTIILGISDIRRRRAEAKKMQSEGKLADANADTQIMAQIKQASIDLMNELRRENEEIHRDNQELIEQVSYYKGVLREHKIIYPSFETRRLHMSDNVKARITKINENEENGNTTR